MAAPKAFLCSLDGTHNFPITQRITTIGRENCDIIINTSNTDIQHALIEFIEEENCYLLQDLNSSNGTFVNGCRVQNATVRLVEQDTVKFGLNGNPLQFIVQSQFIAIPNINLAGINRSSNQSLQVITQTVPSRGNRSSVNNQSGILLSNQYPNASLITINNQTQPYNICPVGSGTKPPASLRSRPITANIDTRSRSTSWIKGHTNTNSFNMGGGDNNIESETYRVDDTEVSSRVVQLERELKIKSIEVRDLREKLAFHKNLSSQNSTSELDQVKRDKSIAVGLVNTMQKDLSNKDSTISKLAREIEGYKRETKEKDVIIKELSDQLKLAKDDKSIEEEAEKKEKELVLLRKKMKSTEEKMIDMTNQVVQIKKDLEESQRKSLEFSKNEKSLKDELEMIRGQHLDMQRSERTVRIDLEQVKRATIYSTPGVIQPAGTEITDELISNEWKNIVDERTNLVEEIDSLKNQISRFEESSSNITKNIFQLVEILKAIESNLITNGRRAASLETEVKKLEEFEIDSSLVDIRNTIINIFNNEKSWQSDLEETFISSFELDMENNDSNRLLLLMVQQKFDALKREKEEVQTKFEEIQVNNEKIIQDQIDLKNQELKQKVTELETEFNFKIEQEIEKLKKEHQEFIVSIKNESEIQINQVNEEKTELLTQIESLKIELEKSKNDLEIALAQDELNEIKKKIVNIEIEFNEKEENFKTQINVLTHKLDESDSNYSKEIAAYKEQIKQYSLTIVNFEKEVKRLLEKEVEYLLKIENIDNKLKDSFFNKKPPTPKPTSPVNTSSSSSTLEITSLMRQLDLLRNENQVYKTRSIEQEELIKTLRRDLSGASAKLSDIHGEMTEKQKRELERNKLLVVEQQRELSDNRAQMAKLSEIVDKQTKQLDALRIELNKSKSLVEKYKKMSDENGTLAVELKSKLDHVECQLQKFENIKTHDGKITNELAAVGAQCKGERHEQVIQRQREALNELRQRVKALEQFRPTIPNSEVQMQQQIMLLKKQLAEVRASQALTEDIIKQANVARGNDPSFLVIEEKTAHFETHTALDASEESYMTLLRTISAILDITEIDGLRSMANLSPDERQKLLSERIKSTESICIRIKEIIDELERKNNIIQDYELDLAKLRQTEFLLKKKSEQLDQIQIYSRNKEDEIEFLKEVLKNTKSDLEREKLLNSAIKQKKPIDAIQQFTERVRTESTDRLHHHCIPNSTKSSQPNKIVSERIKRKDYELKTLKEELKIKNEELNNLTNRLTLVEKGTNYN